MTGAIPFVSPGYFLGRRIIEFVVLIPALALASALAGAQGQGPASNKPLTHSFSDAHSVKNAQPGGSNVASEVLSEQATADAIAAQSLADLFSSANDAHWHHGEYNHIININQVVMEGDPKNLETYSNNAWLLWSTDRKDQGIVTLKKGITANPDTYYMYDELGNFYRLHLKDYSSALPYFETATKFGDCPSLTWHALAQCYEKGGQWDKAVKAWATACRYPNDALAPVRLKRAQAELDKQKKGRP